MRRHDIRLAPFQRLSNTQQPDDIRVISVEELARIRPVDPHFVNLRRVLAEILNVAQDMAAAVLGDEVAQIRAQTHVCHGGLVVAPFLDGEALEEDESFAVEEVLAQGLEVLG